MTEATDDLATSVRLILLEEWDPIGINDVPEAQDEYDSYISRICEMLRCGCSTVDVYKHLRWIESEHMGLDGDEAHTRKIAESLASLRRPGWE